MLGVLVGEGLDHSKIIICHVMRVKKNEVRKAANSGDSVFNSDQGGHKPPFLFLVLKFSGKMNDNSFTGS